MARGIDLLLDTRTRMHISDEGARSDSDGDGTRARAQTRTRTMGSSSADIMNIKNNERAFILTGRNPYRYRTPWSFCDIQVLAAFICEHVLVEIISMSLSTSCKIATMKLSQQRRRQLQLQLQGGRRIPIPIQIPTISLSIHNINIINPSNIPNMVQSTLSFLDDASIIINIFTMEQARRETRDLIHSERYLNCHENEQFRRRLLNEIQLVQHDDDDDDDDTERKEEENNDNVDNGDDDDDDDDDETHIDDAPDNCAICLGTLDCSTDVTSLTCQHRFCTACIEEWAAVSGIHGAGRKKNATCPTCRAPIALSFSKRNDDASVDDEQSQSQTQSQSAPRRRSSSNIFRYVGFMLCFFIFIMPVLVSLCCALLYVLFRLVLKCVCACTVFVVFIILLVIKILAIEVVSLCTSIADSF